MTAVELDKYGSYLVAAFAITCATLGVYAAYLRSRLSGLRRALESEGRRPSPSPQGRERG